MKIKPDGGRMGHHHSLRGREKETQPLDPQSAVQSANRAADYPINIQAGSRRHHHLLEHFGFRQPAGGLVIQAGMFNRYGGLSRHGFKQAQFRLGQGFGTAHSPQFYQPNSLPSIN
jgi:hypothetical protein